jgi:archaellum biogenesis ATPase FlaH
MEAEEIQSLPSEFLQELFRLCFHDQYVLQITIQHLKSNWLPLQVEKNFLAEMVYQVKVENRKLTFGSMLLGSQKLIGETKKEFKEYLAEVREVELADPDTILKGLEDFIKQSIFVEMYDKAADYYNKKQRKQAYRVFKEGSEQLTSFSITTDMVEAIFGNFPKRNTQRVIDANSGHSRMPTGIDELDYRINGGPERKELMCFIADSKGGKSICLTHMGVNYARRGHIVYHFQLEGTKNQCTSRYDSCWSGSSYNDIKAGDFAEKKFESYRRIVDNIGKGEIFIYAPEKYGSMNCIDVRQKIIDLKKRHNVSVVIIDYVDLLNPDGEKYSLSDERHRQEKTMRILKEIAMELDVLIITATQASSIDIEALQDPNFVIRREHLAESKGKVRPVDFLISINRTSDERKKNICRLYIDAARDHEADYVITICQNIKRMRFYDRKKTIEEGHWENAA